MNHARYASPDKPPPKPGTLMASILLNTPTQGFAVKEEIFSRVGRNTGSLQSILGLAVNREYVERQNLPHHTPQHYRLTDRGRQVRYALEQG